MTARLWGVMRAVALALGVLLAATACTTGTDAVDQNSGGEFRFVQGQPAGEVIAPDKRARLPAIEGILLTGGSVNLDRLKGKVLVLNFFASWCAPCRVESPEFDEVFRQFQTQGVEFYGIAVKDTESGAASFVAAKSITYPTIFDPRSEIALLLRDYPTQAIPSTIVVDRDGKVAAVYVAAVSKQDITKTVTSLVAQK